ncbi:MAG: hypothetical protein KBE57_06060, partial [Parabacteroides sp.]|nr:hypothetical protein [Parabacteroides sp.]
MDINPIQSAEVQDVLCPEAILVRFPHISNCLLTVCSHILSLLHEGRLLYQHFAIPVSGGMYCLHVSR